MDASMLHKWELPKSVGTQQNGQAYFRSSAPFFGGPLARVRNSYKGHREPSESGSPCPPFPGKTIVRRSQHYNDLAFWPILPLAHFGTVECEVALATSQALTLFMMATLHRAEMFTRHGFSIPEVIRFPSFCRSASQKLSRAYLDWRSSSILAAEWINIR